MSKNFKIGFFLVWFLVKITPVSFCQTPSDSLTEKFPANNVILPCHKGKNRTDTFVLFIEEDAKEEQPKKDTFVSYLQAVKKSFLTFAYYLKQKLALPQNHTLSEFQPLYLRNCVWRN